MKTKYLILASILILPQAHAENFQVLNLGVATCVKVYQEFENGQPKGPAKTTNFHGPVSLHINENAVVVSAVGGGPNGQVNSLNFSGQGDSRMLVGSSSNHHMLASSGFGQLLNDIFDAPNEINRARSMKIAKRTLRYDINTRVTNGGGNDGYTASSKCDFPADIPLSEIHGIYSAARSAAQVESGRGAEDHGGGASGSSSSSAAGTR